MADLRMRYLGLLGLLAECSVQVDEDTRANIKRAFEDACADGTLRWRRTIPLVTMGRGERVVLVRGESCFLVERVR